MVRKALVVSLIAAISSVVVGHESSAAVRVCKAEMSSGPHLATTVGQGQKMAIDAWMQVAKVVGGDSHTSWRLAISKSLSCQPTEGTKVICIARARPCVIEQVAPKDMAPIKPNQPEPKVITVPKTKAIGI